MINVEEFLIEATKRIAKEKLDKTKFTKSFIGKVTSISDYDCVVDISGSDRNCTIPLNMKRYVAVSDVVVVQDIYNDNTQMLVHGVLKNSIGDEDGDNNIHIFDIVTNEVVSSVLQVYDINTKAEISVNFSVTGE